MENRIWVVGEFGESDMPPEPISYYDWLQEYQWLNPDVTIDLEKNL